MIIHGKERKFLLTVGASADVAELCPNGDLAKIGEVLDNATYKEQLDFICKFAIAMNRGFEENREFEEEGYVAEILTEKELRTLKPAQLNELQAEVMTAFNASAETEIELEPEKKNGIIKEMEH